MFLTDEEKKMQQGEYGPGVRKSMDLLVRYGQAFDAEKMVRANSAHVLIDYRPEPLISELTEEARVNTLSTVHPKFVDPRLATELGIVDSAEVEEEQRAFDRVTEIGRKAGFLQTFSCSHYLIGNLPKIGGFASWSGTSGQVIGNSWFGLRLNRDGASANLATAITGRIPYMGLLRPENRYGEVLVEFDNLDLGDFSEAHYGAVGYYLGAIVEDRTMAVNGIPLDIPLEQCKYFFSPLPVSGAVALCYVVGVSPEAPTLEAALGDREPKERVIVGEKELRDTWKLLNTADGDDVDLVNLGCPHLSITEIRVIAILLEAKKVHTNVKLTLGTSKSIYALAKETGYADIIEDAGGIFHDSCAGASNPYLRFGNTVKTVATNSARAAHYTVRETKAEVLYGSCESCISSALTGKWRDELK